jgi:cytochrome c peroxidase
MKLYLAIAAAALALSACRVDPELPQGGKTSAYQPTPVDPSEIFPEKFGMPALPADNPFTEEGIFLGRMLFYDPILSIDSTVACASCHRQEYAFAEPAVLSTGVFGLKAHRNAPSLFNMAYSRKFFWDARQNTLRELVFEPIQAHNEMAMTLPLLQKKLKSSARYTDAFNKAFQQEPNVMDMAKALEQFMLSMVSQNSKFNDFFPGKFSILSEEEKRGAILFNSLVDFDKITGVTLGADCFHCHGGGLAQQQNPNMGGVANNGLDATITDKGYGAITGNANDLGTFKTPSLLNIALTGPYMHDGRFATLEEVIDHYSDGIHYENPTINPMLSAHGNRQMNLSVQQKSDLVAFLKTMTDSTFINNPAYSNPF